MIISHWTEFVFLCMRENVEMPAFQLCKMGCLIIVLSHSKVTSHKFLQPREIYMLLTSVSHSLQQSRACSVVLWAFSSSDSAWASGSWSAPSVRHWPVAAAAFPSLLCRISVLWKGPTPVTVGYCDLFGVTEPCLEACCHTRNLMYWKRRNSIDQSANAILPADPLGMVAKSVEANRKISYSLTMNQVRPLLRVNFLRSGSVGS